MFDLTGKLAMVTGSSRGIGKQIAIALATAGADVIVHGRTVSGEAEKTAEEIRTLGRNCDILTANMREVDEIEGLFAKIKEKYGWEFMFLAANIDAVETAAKFGIDGDRAVNYNADGIGTHILYDSVSMVVENLRASKPIEPGWSKELNEDYKRRGRKGNK